MSKVFGSAPISMEALRPGLKNLFIARYTPSDDKDADMTAALAALKKVCPLLDTAWQVDNGLYKETTVTTGIAVAYGDGVTVHPTAGGYTERGTSQDVVITLPRAFDETVSGKRLRYPVVEFNNKIVPFSHYQHMGDGSSAGDLVLILDAAAGGYDDTGSKYKVTVWGAIPNVQSMDLEGFSLPQTKTDVFALNFANPLFTDYTNDGGEGSGSISFIDNVGRPRVASGIGAVAEILGYPGEWIERLFMGDGWTHGQSFDFEYPGDGKDIAIATLTFNNSGPALVAASAADAGQVFAELRVMLRGRVTDWGNAQNVASSDAGGQTIQRQVQLTWARATKRVFLTAVA